MSVTFFKVTSNKPRVESPAALLEILKKYYFCRDVNLIPGSEQGTTILDVRSDEPFRGALKAERLPDKEDYEFPDDWLDDVYDLFDESGEHLFVQVLLELAPHLVDPLVVQYSEWDSYDGVRGMKEWHVSRGDKEVRVKEMLALD
jgi:hypothetical protein